jgi:hypothetical protein
MKKAVPRKASSLLFLCAGLVLLACIACLLQFLMDSGSLRSKLRAGDIIIAGFALVALILSFLIAPVISRGTILGHVVPLPLRAIASLMVLFLLPQGTLLYTRIARAMHSEFAFFAVCNLLDIAAGRLLFALFQNKSHDPALLGTDKSTETKEAEKPEVLDRTRISAGR